MDLNLLVLIYLNFKGDIATRLDVFAIAPPGEQDTGGTADKIMAAG
jgi:hypothetical protein